MPEVAPLVAEARRCLPPGHPARIAVESLPALLTDVEYRTAARMIARLLLASTEGR